MPSLLIKKTVRSKMKANGAISGKKTHKKQVKNSGFLSTLLSVNIFPTNS